MESTDPGWLDSPGFYDEEHHPGEIIDSLAKGNIDVALVWGPIAGYFAKKSGVPMTLTPLPDSDSAELPFAYSVAIGTRRSDRELQIAGRRHSRSQEAGDRQDSNGIQRAYSRHHALSDHPSWQCTGVNQHVDEALFRALCRSVLLCCQSCRTHWRRAQPCRGVCTEGCSEER